MAITIDEAGKVVDRFKKLYRVAAELWNDANSNLSIRVTERVTRWLPHVYGGMDVYLMEENNVG